MAQPEALKYRAFLSYSHADAKWAKWLHKALEGYKVDKDLAGRQTLFGPVPDTLRPIFRDREDFTGGQSLNEATIAALDQSATLIVICSPVAATRAAVNEEVRLFRFRHPERPVIPIIIDGKHPQNFPPALLYQIGAEGQVTDKPVTILGPDLRERGEGQKLGLAKVIAGMIGTSADDIFRRAERERQRQARIRNSIAGLIAILALAGGYSYWDSLKKGETIAAQQKEKSLALDIARELLGANPAAAQTPGQEQNLVAALAAIQVSAAKGDAGYKKAFELLKAGKGSDAVPLLLAAAEEKKRRAESENKDAAKAFREAAAVAAVAEPGKARELYAEAARLDPDDVTGLFRSGWAQLEAGQLAAAETAFTAAISKGKPGQDDKSLQWSRIGLGEIQKSRGALPQALANYKEALGAVERLAAAEPTKRGWQFDLGNIHERIGDVQRTQGDLNAALQSFETKRQIVEALAQSKPDNKGWQRDLWVANGKIGDVLLAKGDLPGSLAHWQQAFEITTRLTAADPKNMSWQRDHTVSEEKLGDNYFELGKFDDALKMHQDRLAITQKLAAADPSNSVWQRDLSVSYVKIGDVLLAQSKLEDALKTYIDARTIREQLTKSDPRNANWQRDLSVAHEKVGDVVLKQTDAEQALRSYRDSLAIRERLAKSDASNTTWQRDLSVTYNKLGDALLAGGQKEDALKTFTDALVIREQLARSDPNNAGWQHDLATSHKRLGNVWTKQGEMEKAKSEYASALSIMETLAKLSPDNASWRKDLNEIKTKMQEAEGR